MLFQHSLFLFFLKKLNSVVLENVRYKSFEMPDLLNFQTMDCINLYEEEQDKFRT